jgi:hypothetical protein
MCKINTNTIEDILKFKIHPKVSEMINDFNLEYEYLSKEERDSYILNVINILMSDISKSGKHRINEWENGWDENFKMYIHTKNIDFLIPKYHGKYNILRWKGDVIKSKTPNLDYKLHISFVDSIINHYVGDNKNIFEFGCGPGYHLIRLNDYNNKLNLYGCDWAKSSQMIISEINKNLNLNIKSFNFDFFNPDDNIEIPDDSMIYTIAALEQVGDNFKQFIDFLLNKKPNICINMEPIDELLDNNNLIDNLSIKYFRKRNYLNGYLPYLEKLEGEGKIEIIKKQRIFYGSYFIEGHSLIVWRPKK